MRTLGLQLDEIDEAVEAQGDSHAKARYYSRIRPQLDHRLREKKSLMLYGDLDHTDTNETDERD